MRALLEDFSAPLLATLREQITESANIVFRPLEAMLMPQPWHKGRVVLIGDAVHATTPHLASGACIGIEDGLVLADCISSAQTLSHSLQAFQDRRWERCRMVVENSLRLGEIEMTYGSKDEHTQIMRESLMALAQPI
jgi:2-polyprenyl-6-methoxyphenol hydroxylase-like FAD-dependent oxidoreductase